MVALREDGRPNEDEDNLRIYRITDPAQVRVKQYGTFRFTDLEEPLA